MANELTELTRQEECNLNRAEAVISEGLRSFIAVGNALLEIRDAKLYRTTHSTFAAYLQERWGITRGHGYRMINSARFVTEIQPLANSRSVPIPTCERQVRLLQAIGDPQMCLSILERAQKLSKGKPPAFSQICEAMRQLQCSKQTTNPTTTNDRESEDPYDTSEITQIIDSLFDCLGHRAQCDREISLLKRLKDLLEVGPMFRENNKEPRRSRSEIRIDGANKSYVLKV